MRKIIKFSIVLFIIILSILSYFVQIFNVDKYLNSNKAYFWSISLEYNSTNPNEQNKILTNVLEKSLKSLSAIKHPIFFTENKQIIAFFYSKAGQDIDDLLLKIRDKFAEIKQSKLTNILAENIFYETLEFNNFNFIEQNYYEQVFNKYNLYRNKYFGKSIYYLANTDLEFELSSIKNTDYKALVEKILYKLSKIEEVQFVFAKNVKVNSLLVEYQSEYLKKQFISPNDLIFSMHKIFAKENNFNSNILKTQINIEHYVKTSLEDINNIPVVNKDNLDIKLGDITKIFEKNINISIFNNAHGSNQLENNLEYNQNQNITPTICILLNTKFNKRETIINIKKILQDENNLNKIIKIKHNLQYDTYLFFLLLFMSIVYVYSESLTIANNFKYFVFNLFSLSSTICISLYIIFFNQINFIDIVLFICFFILKFIFLLVEYSILKTTLRKNFKIAVNSFFILLVFYLLCIIILLQFKK